MKLKVVSDGTTTGTKVLDVNTGESLSNVKAVTWHIDSDSITADVVIELKAIPLDVVGHSSTKEILTELSKDL